MGKSKKLLSVLLLCVGAAALTACGGTTKNEDSKTSSELLIKGESAVPTEWPEEMLLSPSPKVFAEEGAWPASADNSKSAGGSMLEDGISIVSGEDADTILEEEAETELEGAVNIFGSVVSPDPKEDIDSSVPESLRTVPAASRLKVITANSATLAACFYFEEISPEIYSRMENKSFSEECTVALEELRYVRVLHYGFDGEIYIGELVVNRKIAQDITEIFKELFDAKYPIERMVLVDNYKADDLRSMAANNTSCFNFRQIEGSDKTSQHSYGLAIDINPLYNPQVKEKNGKIETLPEEGVEYADREADNSYYIKKDDVCYQAFISRGFVWGGDWEKNKDYQHFQKVFQ